MNRLKSPTEVPYSYTNDLEEGKAQVLGSDQVWCQPLFSFVTWATRSNPPALLQSPVNEQLCWAGPVPCALYKPQ